MSNYRFELPEGPVEITIPASLSENDIVDLTEWFELTLRIVARRAKLKEEKNASAS